ncbi:MAG: cryptochrome/photolyase family protein [Schleiferiaceae bacterium]
MPERGQTKRQAVILRLILGDQLNPKHSWFAERNAGVTYALFESADELRYAPHHRQKMLAFLHGMQRFADRLRSEGHRVEHWTLDDPRQRGSLRANLEALRAQLESETGESVAVEYQEPDEFRVDRALDGIGRCVPSEHFLTERRDVAQHFAGKKTYLMESFYRAMRVKWSVLLDDFGQPEGGSWNFDAENRSAWNAAQPVPAEWRAHHDLRDLDARLDRHGIPRWGESLADDFPWPADRDEALKVLDHFIQKGLPLFGRYQDALAEGQDFLFHSRISFALNTKMLHPLDAIRAAEAAWHREPERYPLPAVEGFIRQILGWREYVRGIYWAKMPDYAELNYFGHDRPLPTWMYTGQTRMRCLQAAVGQSLRTAYAHHIQRLMVVGNFALLAGLDPTELDAWYLGIYIDALEWVELPNTRGMSQFADGGIVGTKPYVSSGAYLHKQGNHCAACPYSVAEKTGANACPFNSLYWHFYARNRALLERNPRVGMVYRTWDKMKPDHREALLRQAEFNLQRINDL